MARDRARLSWLRPLAAFASNGHGLSDLAGDVIDLLDHLDVTQAAVVGCSMGGYVLFEMLKSAPRYVSAVGLVSTRPGADNEEGRKNREKMIELVDREGVEAIAAQMVPKLLGATTQRDRPDLAEHVRNLIVENTREGVKTAVSAMMERADSTPLLEQDRRAGAHRSWRGRRADSAKRGRGDAPRDQTLAARADTVSGHLPNLEQPVPFEWRLWQFLKKL